MRVYIAASSGDIERVKWAMEALRYRGHVVTHDWVAEVEKNGEGNPAQATPYQRECWAQDDLEGIDNCDVFWLLMPDDPSFGAGWESGYAYSEGKRMVVSGAFEKSIFPALVNCYRFDSQALLLEFPGG